MFEILEARAAEDAAREAAASATPPVRTSTPVRRLEQESLTTATPLAVNTTSCGWTGEVDFESEDEAALLECAQLDCEAELHLTGMGEGATPVFMSGAMLSYLTNFPLADRLRRLKLSVKRIFTIDDLEFSPDINWGDRAFSNPWVQEEPQECRRGVLVNLGIDSAQCTCDFCQANCPPVNLRPGSRGKIRVVQKVVGDKSGGGP